MTSPPGGIIGPDHPLAKRGKELAGYHVVPRQLAIAGDELKSTASMFTGRVTRELEATHLGPDDLGFLGKQEDTPTGYNSALQKCVDHFGTLAKTLAAAGEVLNEVAAHYAAMDDEYYKKFGRLDDGE